MSIASAQLEEGTILVDPASGNVTSIPSDGGHFAPFQVNPPSGSRARAVRPIRRRSLPQTARRGARAPRRKRAACRASRAPFGPLRFGRCSDVPSLGAFWLCPVCLVLRARACVSDPGQTPCRQDPLNLLFTAAFTVELALNLFAKWCERRRRPAAGSVCAAKQGARWGRRPSPISLAYLDERFQPERGAVLQAALQLRTAADEDVDYTSGPNFRGARAVNGPIARFTGSTPAGATSNPQPGPPFLAPYSPRSFPATTSSGPGPGGVGGARCGVHNCSLPRSEPGASNLWRAHAHTPPDRPRQGRLLATRGGGGGGGGGGCVTGSTTSSATAGACWT